MTEEFSFNLVDQPWLPCIRLDGTQAEYSLLETLLRAHEIRELAVDVPTQLPPILRLMLAVLHRAVADETGMSGPRTEEEWHTLWGQPELPGSEITAYLQQYRDRFDLFHPRAPFLQVAGLRTAKDITRTVALLIPHLASGNNVPVFSGARDDQPPSLTPAEAARWLVHVHAWDTAAIKTGAVGDAKARGGKSFSNPVGALGGLGVLIPTGADLRETLLLNLLVLDSHRSAPTDKPVWEQPPLTPEWRVQGAEGLLALYTWMSRRVRLFPTAGDDEVRVQRVLVAAGDRLLYPPTFDLDPHTAWRRNDKLEKDRTFQPIYLPIRHQPGRQLWRGLGPILARARAVDGSPRDRMPGVLHQLSGARAARLNRARIGLVAVGMTYGNQSAVVDQTYADDLPLPMVLLREAADGPWERVALSAVEAAEKAATATGWLAVNVLRAAGCRDDKLLGTRRRIVASRVYAELDAPFRRWLAELGAGDPWQTLHEWATDVRAVTRRLADELLNAVPSTAVRGREVSGIDGAPTWMNTAQAELIFHGGLKKAFAQIDPKMQETQP